MIVALSYIYTNYGKEGGAGKRTCVGWGRGGGGVRKLQRC